MSHPQPAAELIAYALAKIKKLAGNKKHADLAQECQQLIDSIQEVRLAGSGACHTQAACSQHPSP